MQPWCSSKSESMQ